MTDTPRYDVAVIGGGIVGVATAHALCERPRGSLAVLEAEDHLAAHQSGHNSGVIHSGLYYKPALSKQELRRGARLDVSLLSGARRALRALRQGRRRDPGGELPRSTSSNAAASQRAHGHASARARRGSANTSRTSPASPASSCPPRASSITSGSRTLADSCARRAARSCSQPRFDAAAGATGDIVLETHAGRIPCRALVNCGGLYRDRVARLCGVDPGVADRAVPRRVLRARARARSPRPEPVYPGARPAFSLSWACISRA